MMPARLFINRARMLMLACALVPFAAACDNGPLPTAATTTTTTTTSPVTEVFSSQLSVGGYAFRSITAAKAGTISLTLTSAATTQKLGLGLGIPDATGSTCLFTRTIETTAGGQITATADAGSYCMRVWDLGTLTTATAFSVTIIRP